MNREKLSALAHSSHPIAAPVSDAGVDELLDRLAAHAPRSVLDVGCGSAQWLIRLLQRLPAARGIGVDLSAVALASAAEQAEDAGVRDRLTLHEMSAEQLPEDEHDAVLCIGSTHALGGLAGTFAALHRWASSRAVAVVGDGFWEQPPQAPALQALDCTPEEFPSYDGLVAEALAAGWEPVHVRTSRLDEWDDYEWAWTSALAGWAAANPDDPDAADAKAWAHEHREQWLRGYRGTLGFAVITAGRAGGAAPPA